MLSLYIATRIHRKTELLSRSIEIVFGGKQSIHRVRNFAEELSLSLKTQAGWGKLPMAEADRATTHIHIAEIHAKKLRRVLAFINELLEKHNFDDGISISYGREM